MGDEPLEAEVIDAGETRIVISAEQLEQLAHAWETAAALLEQNANRSVVVASGLGDLALGLVSGTAAQLRADCLRDCARELRDLAASTRGGASPRGRLPSVF